VGNSPRSDINPSLSLGAFAVHILGDQTWAAEYEEFSDPGQVISINRFDELLQITVNFLEVDYSQIK
jgi:hypothetical protein